MKLAELRKLSIKKQLRIRFRLPNGMECVINEHGIAQIPALHTVPDFNLEQALASADEFSIEPATAGDKKKASRPQSVSREQLAGMTAVAPADSAAHDDHDE
jgi:hypothetical protein